jgi:hypothetical protein
MVGYDPMVGYDSMVGYDPMVGYDLSWVRLKSGTIPVGYDQRQSTLDCCYLNLLCDNLKKRMFLQNFFPWHYFGNVLCFSSYPHHSTILNSHLIVTFPFGCLQSLHFFFFWSSKRWKSNHMLSQKVHQKLTKICCLHSSQSILPSSSSQLTQYQLVARRQVCFRVSKTVGSV